MGSLKRTMSLIEKRGEASCERLGGNRGEPTPHWVLKLGGIILTRYFKLCSLVGFIQVQGSEVSSEPCIDVGSGLGDNLEIRNPKPHLRP